MAGLCHLRYYYLLPLSFPQFFPRSSTIRKKIKSNADMCGSSFPRFPLRRGLERLYMHTSKKYVKTCHWKKYEFIFFYCICYFYMLYYSYSLNKSKAFWVIRDMLVAYLYFFITTVDFFLCQTVKIYHKVCDQVSSPARNFKETFLQNIGGAFIL